MTMLDAKESHPLEGGASYSLRHRLTRVAWILTWSLLAAWTPPPLRRWRAFLLGLFGADIASTANVYGSARIWYPANLTMGAYATIGPNVTIYSANRIHLGDHAIISQGAQLCGAGHDIEDPNFQTVTKPIEIGRRAWVAAEAFVGPGVRIGEGAVLGARGCAFRDLEPWTVYAGNPARAIKLRQVRFPNDARAELSASSPAKI